jgi:tetratricopeptide (TPR) repeat protein
LRSAVKKFRHLGRWHDAARLADCILAYIPGTAGRFPGLALTGALGYAQSFDYARADRLLTACQDTSAPPLGAAWQSRVAALHAFIATEQGDLKRAGALIHNAARAAPATAERIWALLARCWADVRGTRTRRADRTLRALAQRLPAEQTGLRSLVLAWRGGALVVLERFGESRQAYAEAAELARRAGWRDRVLATTLNEALNDLEVGESERAARVVAGLLRRHETDGSHHALAFVWLCMGRLFVNLPGAPPAAWAARKTLDLALLAEAWQTIPFAHAQLAFAARSAGYMAEALHHYTRWANLAERVGQRFAVGSAQFQIARLVHYGGDTEEALRLLDSAREIFRETGQPTRMADVHRQKAEFLLDTGRLDAVEAELERAQLLYEQLGWVREAVGVPLLRLELKIRRSPGTISELDLDSMRTAKADAQQQASMAMALLAIGFALLDDRETCRYYARETLARLAIENDLYYNRRVLELARTVRNQSPSAAFLISYWEETLTIPV